MTESTKIKDFLNELIQAQPEIATLLNQGILANQAICDREDIFVRKNIDDQDIVTITGIITAISRKYGEPIASIYDADWILTGFSIREDAYPQIPEIVNHVDDQG